MTLNDLKPGDTFYIDGEAYEAYEVGEDTVSGYALQLLCMTARKFDPVTHSPLEREPIYGRVPDLMGDNQFLIETHSAAAFNRDNG